MNMNITQKIFKAGKKHFEWIAFLAGLLLLAGMNPYIETGPSLCPYDWLGIPFCPGDGLGHSIAFAFRGDIYNAVEANVLGPLAIAIISGRILYLLYNHFIKSQHKKQ